MEFDFYGTYKDMFKMGTVIALVTPDEHLGFRTEFISAAIEIANKFSEEPLARVTYKSILSEGWKGFTLTDAEDGHIWLTAGTKEDHYGNKEFVFLSNMEQKQSKVDSEGFVWM